MVLCPICHREASAGAMTEEEQRRFKGSPFNIQRGYTEGQLKVNQSYCAISMGSNQFVGDSCFIQVDDHNLLAMELSADGRLLLSLQLYDSNDNLLAIIDRNEWISGDPLPWDIESSFQRLKIRRKAGNIALEINTHSMPITVRADLWRLKQNIRLSETEIAVNGTVVKGWRFIDICFVCMNLIINTKKMKFSIQHDTRYGKGHMIAWPDMAERIEMGRIEWLKLQGRYPEGL